MAEVDPKLMALAYLEGARHDIVKAASLLDDVTTRTCHQYTMEAMEKIDEAQTLTAAVVSGEEPEFKSSVPERCKHTDTGVPNGVDPRCMKEADHEGPHMYGVLDDVAPPA